MPRHTEVLRIDRLRLTDPRTALALIEELLLTDPSAPAGGAYDVLGQICLVQGDLKSAKDSFLRNIEIYPREPSTWLYLALIAELQGDLTEAEACYRKAPGREFDPEYIRAAKTAYTAWQATHPGSESRLKALDAAQQTKRTP